MTSLPVLPPRPESGSVSRPRPALDVPVPRYFSSLPRESLEELTQSPQLLQGSLKAEQGFRQYEAEQERRAEAQIQELRALANEVKELRERYSQINNQAVPAFAALRTEWQATEVETYRNLERFSLVHLKGELKNAVADADARSRLMVEAMVEKDGLKDRDLQGFMREFRDQRKLYHLRRERLARWTENRVGGDHYG